VIGTDWTRTVYGLTAGKAKAHYFYNVKDAWPDVPFTAIRTRLIKGHRPANTESFERTKRYRAFGFDIGDPVRVGEHSGFVVGSNDSANFDILFVDGPAAGLTRNVHPGDIMTIRSATPEHLSTVVEVSGAPTAKNS
jgi:hypothetical protein